jgi:hypothetical protein
MTEQKQKEQFKLIVPLDASGIENFKPDQEPKVVVKDRKGSLHSQKVKLDNKGHGSATFTFDESPGPLGVFIGPGDASDEEMLGLQTISFNVSTRKWANKLELKLHPLRITPYYWRWWLWWCRTFTIRGRVVCADGSPVPGAKVCAYDVDWWWCWSSTQLVGCATTDINGEFEIKFRWCCGWWPWWWWRNRVWQLDPVLAERVGEVLKRTPNLKLSPINNQPSLAVFNELLAKDGQIARRSLRAADVGMISRIRERLLKELPAAPELEHLRIWPWFPWHPWWDCTPDIIFKVTQDCDLPGEVIYEEGVRDTRWNISNPLEVTLEAYENACCRPQPCPNPPCEEGECLIIDTVCDFPFDQVGGNPGADPTPVGYLFPGTVPVNTHNSHRPFAGIIPIKKNPGDMLGVDYYEIEVYDDDPSVLDWVPLPMGAAVDFYRRYWDTAIPEGKWAPFPFVTISGHNVVETREHYEAASGMTWDIPGGDAWWLDTNWSMLVPLDTRKFNDGTYRFRIVGWQESGGSLVNPNVLLVCGTQDANEFVLTFDNRVTNDTATHDPTHNCGGIHLCTTEPDTHIIAVRINGVSVDPCDTADITPGGILEVDFLAHDSDAHLAYYQLYSTWGLNQHRNLLAQPGANVTVISGGPSGWYSGQGTGNYGTALDQGAVAPHWAGGTFRLTIPMNEAFPEPCCYQLELWAFKRNIVGSQSYRRFLCYEGIYRNKTEYSLGVGVCPPPTPPIIKATSNEVVIPTKEPVIERK